MHIYKLKDVLSPKVNFKKIVKYMYIKYILKFLDLI